MPISGWELWNTANRSFYRSEDRAKDFPRCPRSDICGGSSAGRASDFQSEGRGFETRPPLHAPLGRRVVVSSLSQKGFSGRQIAGSDEKPRRREEMPATYGDVTERQCKIRSGQLGGASPGSETTVRGSSPRRLHQSAPCGVGGAIQVKETDARSPAMA